jgi:hypothetical protein
MITATADRVTKYTATDVQDCIRDRTDASLIYHLAHPDEIPARLSELDREWDVERTLETGSSTLTLLGLALGATVNRKWLLLSLGVQGFFLQHALQGWCPPLPVLRRLGVRTTEEIDEERWALISILHRAALDDLTEQLAIVRAALSVPREEAGNAA